MSEKLERDAAARAAARTLAYYLTFGFERDGKLWDSTNEDEIATAVDNIVRAAVHRVLTDSALNGAIGGLQQRVANANQAFKGLAGELTKQREELHTLRQRLDALEQAALRGGAARKRLDVLESENKKGTETMNLLAARIDALEQRETASDETEQIRHGRLGPLLPWEGWHDSDEPATSSTGLADIILTYLRAREKRAAIEGALQQARARESQLVADVRRMVPGPGMYRVGDEYVVVSPDEVYPAAAPVEVVA